MANVDKAYGLQPYDPSGAEAFRTTAYFIPSSDSTPMFVGDPVTVQGGANTVATGDANQYGVGTLQIVAKSTAGSTNRITGAITSWAFIDNSGNLIPTVERPASKNAIAMVCDDPNISYRIQSAGSPVDADVGANVNLIFTNSGDTTNGQSGVEANGTATLDATKQLYIQSLAPDNGNVFGANAQLIVRINLPLPNFDTAGV